MFSGDLVHRYLEDSRAGYALLRYGAAGLRRSQLVGQCAQHAHLRVGIVDGTDRSADDDGFEHRRGIAGIGSVVLVLDPVVCYEAATLIMLHADDPGPRPPTVIVQPVSDADEVHGDGVGASVLSHHRQDRLADPVEYVHALSGRQPILQHLRFHCEALHVRMDIKSEGSGHTIPYVTVAPVLLRVGTV